MNARTVKKLLLRGRNTSFWGRRAYLHLRVPKAVLTVPRPPMPSFGKQGSFEGYWTEDRGEGVTRHFRISHISSNRDPLKDDDIDHTPRCPTLEYEGKTSKGEPYQSWSWWEALWSDVREPAPGSDEKPEVLAQGEIDDERFTAYVTHYQWVKKYVVGSEGETGNEILDRVHGAARWAKTTYHQFDANGDLIVIYSVKYFYPYRVLRFSSDLASTVNYAAKHGVTLRVLKGSPPGEAD
jgi:hypothetical protein